ncbi:MAG: LuxR C-terminal-related transcriptional regulator [Opitutaceae bacterium]|jgi:DNA-binding CsgD family transcriptional regulator|nr:LuxR C-terminal-related transcriptional regulator [Opitutaceae bacterium]
MVTINPEPSFGQDRCTTPSDEIPVAPAILQWSGLQNLITLFPGLSWIEDKTGRILLSGNPLPGHHWPLPEPTLAYIKKSLQERPASCPVTIPDRHGHPVALRATAYPLPCFDHHELPLRLIFLCPPAKEPDGNRAIIAALVARLLKTTLAETQRSCSRLTPQQQAIYQDLSCGHRYKEIAARLGISHLTVRVQITRMRKVLGSVLIPILRRSR